MLNIPGNTMLASVATTLILSFIYLALYRQGKRSCMLLWGSSWLSYSIMFFLDLMNFSLDLPGSTYVMLRQLMALAGSWLFLHGTAEFLEFRLPSHSRSVVLVSAAAIMIYPLSPDLQELFLVPNVIICSLMLICAGCLFLSISWTRNVPEQTFASVLILLWSIFINHFIFAQRIEALAFLSYHMSLIIANSLIVTVMIINFRRLRFLDNQMSARFRLLVENSSDIMFLYHYGTGRFEYASPKIISLIGVSAEHLYAEPGCFFDHVKPEEGSARLLTIFKTPVQRPGEGTMVLTDGASGTRWSEVHYVPIIDSSGTVIAIEGILHDITQQRMASAEIAAAENAKAEFLQDISHEIKTPITIIRGYSESLMSHMVPKESTDTYVKMIHSKALLLNDLLDDLTSASDFSSQSMEYRFYEIQALEFFSECLEEERLRIAESGRIASIECVIRPEAVIIADTTRIKQVISNLVGNAIRHTPAGNGITISCGSYHHEELLHMPKYVEGDEIPKGDIVLSVIDTGEGIPDAALPHIFERSYSGPNRVIETSYGTPPARTGLGLFISRQIISQHSGTISARNVPGGAEFTFRIPYYL